MKRRSFLRSLGGAAAGLGLGTRALSAAGAPTLQAEGSLGTPNATELPGILASGDDPAFGLWCWVHGGGDRTPEDWILHFRRLKTAGFSGVLVGGGDTEVLSTAAHENGLEFHRWLWTLNRNGDEWVKENHPEWFTVSRKLESSLEVPPYVGYYRWLCPTRSAVREYLQESILEIAQDPRVDGIHLDYVRHCDVILPRGLWSKYDLIQDTELPEFDFCYCDTCREEFSAKTGTDPLDLPDPSADEEWRRFRWDSVTRLVRDLAGAVHGVPQEWETPAGPDETSASAGTLSTNSPSILRPMAPGKPISAAVFPTPAIARRLVRQAWDEWPLDAFFPMLYHEFYEEGVEWIGRGVEEGIDQLGLARESGKNTGPAPKLFAGLYLPTLNRDGNRNEAVEIARQAGAHGVSFFEMGGLGLEG